MKSTIKKYDHFWERFEDLSNSHKVSEAEVKAMVTASCCPYLNGKINHQPEAEHNNNLPTA